LILFLGRHFVEIGELDEYCVIGLWVGDLDGFIVVGTLEGGLEGALVVTTGVLEGSLVMNVRSICLESGTVW